MAGHKVSHGLAEPTGPGRPSVGHLCHDIRNSLTVIEQYASIIADGLRGPVTQRQKECLDTIIKAVDETAGMVDGLQQHATPNE